MRLRKLFKGYRKGYTSRIKNQVRKYYKKILRNLITSEILSLFYADNSVMPQTTRNNIIDRIKITIDQFSKFSLVVYAGLKRKNPK